MERTVWEHCFEWRVVTKVQTYLTRFCVFPLHCNVLNLIHVELLYLLVAIKWVAIIFTFPVGREHNSTLLYLLYKSYISEKKYLTFLRLDNTISSIGFTTFSSMCKNFLEYKCIVSCSLAKSFLLLQNQLRLD